MDACVSSDILVSLMPPKRALHALQASCNHSRKSSPIEVVSTDISTPVKKIAVEEISTSSTKGSTLTRSTIGSPGTMSLTKVNFNNLVSAEFEEVKKEFISMDLTGGSNANRFIMQQNLCSLTNHL